MKTTRLFLATLLTLLGKRATGWALTRSHFPLALVLLLSAPLTAVAQADYTITNSGGVLTVTNSDEGSDTLDIFESPAGSIRFAAAGRTFSVNGGSDTLGQSNPISLTGLTSIIVNAEGGTDTLNVGAFGGSFPSLTINGGTGNDTVNFNGDINFAPNKNLDVNLQDDGGAVGVDAVNVAAGANLIATGSGGITVLCSKSIALASGASLGGGPLTLEANQQTLATAGNFVGVRIDGASLACAGLLTVRGRGGNDPGGSQLGVEVVNGGEIFAQGDITVEGTGGDSTGLVNRGVTVYGSGSLIRASTGSVEITGTAGASGGFFGIGVSVLFGGEISAEFGSVNLTGTGAGAAGSGFNQGLELSEPGSLIASDTGNIVINGTAGPGDSVGVYLSNEGAVSTPAAGGNVTVRTDSLSIDGTASISTAGPAAKVTLGQRNPDAVQIDLGGAAPAGKLSLTDAVLDRITTGNLTIGVDSTTGLNISAPVSPSNAAALTLAAFAIRAPAIGTDVTLNASGTLTLAGPLACHVTGAAADTGYPQLKVVGGVNLNGRALNLTGTFAGVAGNIFTLVDNDAADAIMGTFAGLPQNAYLPWPGSTALAARISYTGGTGNNDVVLTLRPVAEALNVTNTADGGASSLRAVIAFAAAHSGADTVTFASNLAGQTIRLNSAIAVNDAAGVTINAPAGGIAINGDTNSDGIGDTQLFTIAAGSTVTMTGLNLTQGSAAGGGAIFNRGTLTLQGCTLSDNKAPSSSGGAIYNQSGGFLTLTTCTVSANFAGFHGGAIWNNGTLTLTQSTFSGNSAGGDTGGGAIRNQGATLTSTHCTFSNNSAPFGGALVLAGGSAIITHCTFAGNQSTGTSAVDGGGAIRNFANGNLTLNYTLLAGNTAASGSGPDLWMENGALTASRNLLSKGENSTLTHGVNGNLVGSNTAPIDALLLPLGSYGGPTLTMPPRPDSPAVDAALGSTAAIDQRGVFRPFNGDLTGPAVRDIGAVEFNNFLEVTTTADELNNPAGPAVSLREALRDATEGALIHFSPLVFTGLTPATNTITLTGGELIPSQGVAINAINIIPTGVTVDGGPGSNRIFYIAPNKTVSLLYLTLTGGNGSGAVGPGSGGAIYNDTSAMLALTRCTLSGNSAGGGGAIGNFGMLALTDSTLSGNTAGFGGAIDSDFSSTTTLTRCTLSGNSASPDNGGAISAGGTATLTHCTLAGNSAGDFGGAIGFFGPTSLTHCTVSANSAPSGGGLGNGGTGGLNLSYSIVAGNTTGNINSGFSGANNITTGDPLLASLGNYGGLTKTMALKPLSLARNNATGSSAMSDQRLFPIVGVPDIGAYEAGTFADFDAWAVETTGAALSATADNDFDGAKNLLEYALRRNALVSDAHLSPTFAFDGERIVFSFPYQSAARDLRYIIQHNPDLLSAWTNVASFDTRNGMMTGGPGLVVNPGLGTITFTDPVPPDEPALPPESFYRLLVELVP